MAKDNKKVSKISRQEFFGFAWGISLVMLIGQAGVALLQFFKSRTPPGGFGDEVVAGNLQEFEPGTVNHVQKGRFYIVHLDEGGVLALWQRCTHLGCTISWQEEEDRFNCPCHSSLFNRRGEVVGGPAPRPMDLFPVSLVEGQLVVDTGAPVQRQQFKDDQVFYPG